MSGPLNAHLIDAVAAAGSRSACFRVTREQIPQFMTVTQPLPLIGGSALPLSLRDRSAVALVMSAAVARNSPPRIAGVRSPPASSPTSHLFRPLYWFPSAPPDASASPRRSGGGDTTASTRGLRAGWSAGVTKSEMDGSETCRFGANSASAACGALVINSRSSPRACGSWLLSKTSSERFIHSSYRIGIR